MQKYKLLIHSALIASMVCLIGLSSCSHADAGDFQVDSRRDLATMKRKIRAAQFLQRATFGPTIEQIDELAERMQQIGVTRACTSGSTRSSINR